MLKRQENLGALIYPEPVGPPRPVAGDLYNVLLDKEYLFIVQGKWIGMLRGNNVIGLREMDTDTLS